MVDAFITPIQKLNFSVNNNVFYVKREDLYPFSFGGNKVRIAEKFFIDLKKKGKNCIIGYGGVSSNLNRAIANMAAKKHIKCYIVCAITDEQTSINKTLTELCDAEIIYCRKSDVAETIETTLKKCQDLGYDPYYINGNSLGMGNESVPVEAYMDVYDEIKNQSVSLSINYDYIFLPVGTGMTISGLIMGANSHQDHVKVIGISIANNSLKVKEKVYNFIKSKDNSVDKIEINIDDSALCGGYGKSCLQEIALIKKIFVEEGMPLDSIYSGKAFYGMVEYINRNNIKGKNILFVHTGGVPNFFDYMIGRNS